MKKQWCLLISLWQTQNLFPLFTGTDSEIIYTAIPKTMMCSYWTENSHNTVDFSHKYLQMYFAVYVWAKPVARISQQGSQKPQGCHILKIPYWMWQTWNVWAQIFNGGRAPLAPPLATALVWATKYVLLLECSCPWSYTRNKRNLLEPRLL